MNTIKAVKGTTDYYPVQFSRKQHLIDAFSKVCQQYDYQFIETPVFETLELLSAKGSDEIKEQLFVLEQKGSERLAMRFDMTVPCARLFVQRQKELLRPVRWAYACENFRYERPQAGRQRSFYQLGCEVYGASTVLCDAELLSMIIDTFSLLKLTAFDYSIRISHRDLLEGILSHMVDSAKVPSVITLFDKFAKVGKDAFLHSLEQELDIEKETAYALLKLVQLKGGVEVLSQIEPFTVNEKEKQALLQLKQIAELVPKEYLEFDMSIARGLDYYTGIVFECFDRYGYFRSLAGGGRYDRMIEQFGGEACPATGFAIGLSTLNLLLEKLERYPQTLQKPDYCLCVIGEEASLLRYALDTAKQLRSVGKKIHLDLSKRAMGKRFSYAESLGASAILFIGEEEAKKKTISYKDLVTGDKKECTVNDL